MKRLALSCLALVALTSTSLGQSAPADVQYLETLQARIAALESRVKQLESSLKAASNVPAPAPKKAEAPKPEVPAAKQAKAESPRKQRNYQIQEGDTISEIARMHGIPRSALMDANKMREGQQIYIGDQIVIPSPPGAEQPAGSAVMAKNNATSRPSGEFTTYTVKYGDTLSSIARKNGVSVAEIKSANAMSSDNISGGQKLKIPSGKGSGTTVASNTSSTPPQPPAKPAASSKKAPASGGEKAELLLPEETYGLYTVERGDTLFSLARDFFTSESEIRRLNEMGASNSLKPGADLVVPTSKYFEHHHLANR